MENANKPGDVVEQHAKLLMYHDPGEPGFANVALRFAQLYDDLVRRASGPISGQGQVLQVIAVLADEDRLSGTVLGSHDRARFTRTRLCSSRAFFLTLPFSTSRLDVVSTRILMC